MKGNVMKQFEPSAIKAVRAHGVAPSVVHYVAANNWNIHPNVQDCFEVYFLSRINAGKLLAMVFEGQLKRGEDHYVVLYHRCTRGQLLADKSIEVVVSFRQAKPEYGIPAYALVSIQNIATIGE